MFVLDDLVFGEIKSSKTERINKYLVLVSFLSKNPLRLVAVLHLITFLNKTRL